MRVGRVLVKWRGVAVTGNVPVIDGALSVLVREPEGRREEFGSLVFRPPWVRGTEIAGGLALGWRGAGVPHLTLWPARIMWARMQWRRAGRPVVIHGTAQQVGAIRACPTGVVR